jgi:peptidoglycan/xylan/chitin deacetylase (PgdA/CDA1 family)
LSWLADRGFRSLSLAEFESAVRGADVGSRRFLLTFDDGSADLPRCAEMMRPFGFSGVAFLITDRVGRDSACATWPDVVGLARSGTMEFQSHSHTHVRWDFSDNGKQQVAEELRASRELLASQLNVSNAAIRHLAWPWGRCSHAFEAIAIEAGFGWQYLVQYGSVIRNRMQLRLPRLCADGMTLDRCVRMISWMSNPWGAAAMNLASGASGATFPTYDAY